MNDNIFLSQDKITSTFQENTNLKLKIKNVKDQTPVNIFSTYLKQSNIVSPIPMENNDFYENDTVYEFFDFNKRKN